MTNNAFINLQAFIYVLKKVGLSFRLDELKYMLL